MRWFLLSLATFLLLPYDRTSPSFILPKIGGWRPQTVAGGIVNSLADNTRLLWQTKFLVGAGRCYSDGALSRSCLVKSVALQSSLFNSMRFAYVNDAFIMRVENAHDSTSGPLPRLRSQT